MSMPAPASAPPAYPQKRSNGCLWGCLGVLLIFCLPMVLAGAYGSWFLWSGYKRDPVLRVVGELVTRNGTARAVLGDGIIVTGVEGNVFSWTPGLSSNAAIVALAGSKGEGRLAVTSHAGATGPILDSAILTGPGGGRYDLLQQRMLGAPDNSI